MHTFLYILSVINFIVGFWTLTFATTVLQEICGFIIILTAAVLLTGGAVVNALDEVKRLLISRQEDDLLNVQERDDLLTVSESSRGSIITRNIGVKHDPTAKTRRNLILAVITISFFLILLAVMIK
jgi:hypothetical protein